MTSTSARSAPKPPPVVLVVEDEPMVGEVVQAMLKMGGFESVHAKDPLEALEILKDPSQHFDVLLTDFRLPQMSGIELIQQTRPLRPGLKTILYSGDADLSDKARYLYQPDKFLRKPFAPKTLNDLVASLLASESPSSH